MTIRKALVAFILPLLFCSVVWPQTRSGVISFHVGHFPPLTLERLVDGSNLIAAVTVRSIFPTTKITENRWETDTVLMVDNVLKGANPGGSIVVGQPGGVLGDREIYSTQFSRMELGRRYLLFLVPSVGGVSRDLPRYSIYDVFIGIASIDDGRLRWSSGMEFDWKNEYDNLQIQDATSRIVERVSLYKIER